MQHNEINPKHEILNPKQIAYSAPMAIGATKAGQITKIQNLKFKRIKFEIRNRFGHSDFARPS